MEHIMQRGCAQRRVPESLVNHYLGLGYNEVDTSGNVVASAKPQTISREEHERIVRDLTVRLEQTDAERIRLLGEIMILKQDAAVADKSAKVAKAAKASKAQSARGAAAPPKQSSEELPEQPEGDS